MKTATGYLVVCMYLMTQGVWAQNQNAQSNANQSNHESLNVQRTIELLNDSKSEDVIITIEKGTNSFRLMIYSQIKGGKLAIELHDPNGKKQATFSVGTQMNSAKKTEQVYGQINKELKEPQVGDWIVKIIPTDASGSIDIRTIFMDERR